MRLSASMRFPPIDALADIVNHYSIDAAERLSAVFLIGRARAAFGLPRALLLIDDATGVVLLEVENAGRSSDGRRGSQMLPVSNVISIQGPKQLSYHRPRWNGRRIPTLSMRWDLCQFREISDDEYALRKIMLLQR